jgi:hypothetical protein
MFKRILFSLLFIMIIATLGFSQGRGIGLGLTLGEPTGISFKGWVTGTGAIQIGLGYPSLSYSHGTALSAEYLWHSHVFRSREYFPLSYGIGGIFGVSGGTNIMGARGVIGIAWWPHHSSLDVFLQVVPTMYFKPVSDFEFDFGFGVRFFF